MQLTTILIISYAAHYIADHLVQTDAVVAHKVEPGWRGWLWATRHGAEHFALTLAMLYLDVLTSSSRWDWTAALAGAGFIAVTHTVIDRRWPTRWVLRVTRSPKFAEMTTPLHGMYLGDQSLHMLALFIGSLIAAHLWT